MLLTQRAQLHQGWQSLLPSGSDKWQSLSQSTNGHSAYTNCPPQLSILGCLWPEDCSSAETDCSSWILQCTRTPDPCSAVCNGPASLPPCLAVCDDPTSLFSCVASPSQSRVESVFSSLPLQFPCSPREMCAVGEGPPKPLGSR